PQSLLVWHYNIGELLLEQIVMKKYCCLLLLLAFVVTAKVDKEIQTHLSKELTPLGAIRSGNGGLIPDWTGGSSFSSDDQPLFIVTTANIQQHKDKLTIGQLALFAQYPDTFSMPVYATHRTASAPDWVYKNTAINAINTTLNKDQTGFENALGGIPFPVPNSALEVYFNHVSRWRGLQLENRASDAVVFKKGSFTLFTRKALVRFDGYLENSTSKYFVSLVAKILAPAVKSGGGVLLLEPLDQLNETRAAWTWDKGRRRVLRAPNVAYDNPVSSASSLRTVDDTDLINGSPDKFNWELLEKREIYIPYNNEQLASKDLKYKDILHKGHINPEHTRYELHRVWVIQATLKEKWRHVYSKRTFYIDEDTWQVVAADQYNKQGKLWRVSLSYPKFYSGMPGMFPVINVFHDLISQQYHVTGLQNEEKSENIFNGGIANKIAKDGQFTPSGFKRFMR
ncbi:MAG: DUF1329 domain-containing protein, partial [Proteobacteria bacterium]|nr:DUF1329 domain-containing protein [Pseudomonadota bacterium]